MRLGRRAALLALLLLALLALSGILAYEAWSAAGQRRALAEQAMREYAAYGAAKYRDNVQGWLYVALDEVFAGAWMRLADHAPAFGDAAAALDRSGRSFEGCRCAPTVHQRYTFEVQVDSLARIRRGTIAIRGAMSPSGSERHWVADTVLAHVRASIALQAYARWRYGTIATAHRFATIIGTTDPVTILVYTLRSDSAGRPRTAFGFATDAAHFVDPFFPSLYRSRIVLPPLLTGWVPNDSLLSVYVADSLGRVLFRSGKQYASPYGAELNMDPPLGHLRVHFSVRPAVEQAILVGGVPGSRVPLLLGILAGTAAITVLTLLQLRAELETARQRANFVASVSHELRTPLAQILLFAETVRLGRAPSEERRHHAVDVIIREAHRLIRLVENVLHVTRADRAPARVSLEWIVLRHVVTETVEEFAPLAREAGSEVMLDPVDGGILANADPGAVRQMLLNVLDNAVKYGAKGQTIQVGVTYAEGTARVWVDDEGPGVAAADRGRIWKPFVRLERAARPGVAGAGIGLAVVRELVAAQRGRAWVEHGARGGARFVITLPGALAEDDGDGGGASPLRPSDERDAATEARA